MFPGPPKIVNHIMYLYLPPSPIGLRNRWQIIRYTLLAPTLGLAYTCYLSTSASFAARNREFKIICTTPDWSP